MRSDVSIFTPGTEVAVIVPVNWGMAKAIMVVTVDRVTITASQPDDDNPYRVYYKFKEHDVKSDLGMHESWVFASETEALENFGVVD